MNIINIYFSIEINVSKSSRNKHLVSFVSIKSGVEKVLSYLEVELNL